VRSSHVFAATVLCSLLLGGCGSSGPDGQEVAAKADAARTQITRLAAAVGTDPEVQQDTITDCVPGRKDSGKDLIYNVRVTVERGVLRRVVDHVVPDFEARGWDVRRRGDDEVVFRKDDVTMGATIFADQGLATVSGTGGCVT
jgi:outer membrane murein-binding lipoprotein Lpp